VAKSILTIEASESEGPWFLPVTINLPAESLLQKLHLQSGKGIKSACISRRTGHPF